MVSVFKTGLFFVSEGKRLDRDEIRRKNENTDKKLDRNLCHIHTFSKSPVKHRQHELILAWSRRSLNQVLGLRNKVNKARARRKLPQK